MIDLNKIEEAAKAATPGPWRFELSDGVHRPYVVRGREGGFAVAGLSRTQENSDATHIATSDPSTVLEMIGMIRERNAVLKQALTLLEEQAEWETLGDPAMPATKAVEAIKEILK